MTNFEALYSLGGLGGRENVINNGSILLHVDALCVYVASGSLLNEERHELDAARSVRTSEQSRQSSLAQRENGAVIVKNGYSADASSAVDRKKEKVPSATIRSSEVRKSEFVLICM